MANGGLHCDLFGFVVYLQFDYEVDVFDREGGGGTAGCLLGMDDRRNAFYFSIIFYICSTYSKGSGILEGERLIGLILGVKTCDTHQ